MENPTVTPELDDADYAVRDETGNNKSSSISFTPQHRKAIPLAQRKLAVGGKPATQAFVVAAALDMYLPTLGIVLENAQPGPVE